VNPFRSVGARLSLALVAVVALALVLVYLIVVPSLRSRLIDAKLNRMEKELPTVVAEIPVTEARANWADNLERWSGRADARVVVYTIQTTGNGSGPSTLNVYRDSSGVSSLDVADDAIATAAADSGSRRSGTVKYGDDESAEVAQPVGSNYVALLSAPLRDPLANVHTVQRRLVEAGVLALLLALGVGYGAAFLFARRIRRLEAAAERIASGRFDQPVVDRSPDELGQLARAFDRMRLRLAQLERARREFIGNASHELRTPLFSLRGFIELLTDEDLDEPTRAEFLDTMREQVDRLQRLAEDLLDLTRLDAGRIHIERQPVDLRELAEDLCDEFRAVAAAGGHPLELEGSGNATALGDEGRVLRIGRALVENALMHTPPGTRVTVRTSGNSLAVWDEGPGIPPEYLGNVFDRFYRVDGTRASGSGLGLAIARELAEAMGGTLEARSAPGDTSFSLRLPTSASDEQPGRFHGKTDRRADIETGVV
jgi:signal transduction histidine kinase